MKQFLLCLVTTVIAVTAWGQSVTLQFAKENKKRNYQVVINGTTYNASAATARDDNRIMIDDLSVGSHTLAVYPADASVNTDSAVYRNTFQLRQGYDMNITLRANGEVSFTESRTVNTATSSGTYHAETGMRSADFDRLAESVRARLLQSSRISAVRAALENKENYFTTQQISQLLSYVKSEPVRLELAKAGYARVVDSANYRNLNELFSSESLRSELDFYLKNTTVNPGADTRSGTAATTGVKPKERAGKKADSTVKAKARPGKEQKVSVDEKKNNSTVKEESTMTTAVVAKKPMTNRTFNQLVKKVKSRKEQPEKVAVLTEAFQSPVNNFNTTQLRQLLTPVTGETDKLTLAKLAFARTTDSANYSTLYDLFQEPSSRFELEHFVRFGHVGTTVTTPSKYAYREAIDDADYSRLDLKVQFRQSQSSMIAEMKKAFSSKHYFTVEQIRQWLSLVTSESDRVELAKLAYLRINDPETFTTLNDLFPSQESREELDNYIAANRF